MGKPFRTGLLSVGRLVSLQKQNSLDFTLKMIRIVQANSSSINSHQIGKGLLWCTFGTVCTVRMGDDSRPILCYFSRH